MSAASNRSYPRSTAVFSTAAVVALSCANCGHHVSKHRAVPELWGTRVVRCTDGLCFCVGYAPAIGN